MVCLRVTSWATGHLPPVLESETRLDQLLTLQDTHGAWHATGYDDDELLCC